MRSERICRQILAWVLVLGAAVPPQAVAQQGVNNLWMGGYYENPDTLLGGVDLEFLSGSRVVSAVDRAISFYRTNANITDDAGQLLFSSNGAYLANANGEQM